MNGKILTGQSASPGIVVGKVCVVKTDKDIAKVRQGDIVVLPYSHPIYTLAVMKASAVICEIGGLLSHLCVVSMEMGIPCITKVENATKIMQDGQLIHVDANEGVITIHEG